MPFFRRSEHEQELETEAPEARARLPLAGGYGMSRQRKARPRAKRYLQRPVSLPMTGAKRNEIALHMHAAFTGVAAGDLDSFDALANIINIAQLVMVNDDRFTREFRLANGAAMAL